MKKKVNLIVLILFLFLNSQAQKTAPNIILFLVDDMGWQDTSLPFWTDSTALNKKFHTPNMERLAKMGVKMTNAYANPVCTPTRVSIITGINSARHHVTNWTNVKKDTPTDYPDDQLKAPEWNYNGYSPVPGFPNSFNHTALPQVLKKHGYFTVHTGKAHFASYETPGSSPLNIGYDVNIGGSSAGHPGSYLASKNYKANANDTLRNIKDLEEYIGSNTFLTEALTQKALKTISGKSPFFLYLGHYAVHLPFEKDDRFYQKYIDAGLDDNEAKYAALIEGMDKSLGDVIDYLEKNKLTENTYIIFMSDNGGLSVTPLRSGIAQTHNLPLKQGKGSIYEGGIRVPMIVSGPGIKGQTISNQYLSIDDFFPTILEMAKIKNTDLSFDGESMFPYFKYPNLRNDDKVLLWNYPNKWSENRPKGYQFTAAMRKGDYKLVYFYSNQQYELYNLKNDIGEHNDLFNSERGKANEMKKLFLTKLEEMGAQFPTEIATGKVLKPQ